MVLADLLSHWLPISGLVAILLLVAYHGWEAFEWLTRIGNWVKMALGTAILLAAAIILGVIEGFDLARLSELVGGAVAFVMDLVASLL